MKNLLQNEFTLGQIRAWAKYKKYSIKTFEHADGDYATCAINFMSVFNEETGTDYYWANFVMRQGVNYFSLVDCTIQQYLYESTHENFNKDEMLNNVNSFLISNPNLGMNLVI